VKGETKSEKKEQKGEVHTSEFQEGSLFSVDPISEESGSEQSEG
jgi:hypothetical protein